MSVEVLASSALAAVPHGFLGRRGGVSRGLVAGLNVGLGSDDDPEHVARNRALAVEAVAPGRSAMTGGVTLISGHDAAGSLTSTTTGGVRQPPPGVVRPGAAGVGNGGR